MDERGSRRDVKPVAGEIAVLSAVSLDCAEVNVVSRAEKGRRRSGVVSELSQVPRCHLPGRSPMEQCPATSASSRSVPGIEITIMARATTGWSSDCQEEGWQLKLESRQVHNFCQAQQRPFLSRPTLITPSPVELLWPSVRGKQLEPHQPPPGWHAGSNPKRHLAGCQHGAVAASCILDSRNSVISPIHPSPNRFDSPTALLELDATFSVSDFRFKHPAYTNHRAQTSPRKVHVTHDPQITMTRINIHVTAANHELNDDILSLDVALDLSLADLKAYIQAETDFEPSKQQFFIDGQPLAGDSITLQQAGIKDGDMLAVLIAQDQEQAQRTNTGAANRSASSRQQDGLPSSQIEAARQQFLRNPAQIRSQAPDLADVLHDPARFRDVFERRLAMERRNQGERERQIALLNEDPMNVEAQRRIEELIREQNVEANLNHAFEYHPESFGSVNMLYINVKINSHPVKVLVDSGAQMTVMSPSCAEECNIMRLIDRRYQGIARGVGTAKILGKVHSADINIAEHYLPCSFMVMEGKAVDLLLGLDMLKRFQVSIDLKRNKLVFSDFEVDFLPESEIPKMQEEERTAEPTVLGPDGTEIGTESGVVKPAGSIPKPSTNGPLSNAARHNLAASQPSFGDTPGAAPGPVTAPSGQTNHPREKIDQLVGLGFSERDAVAALNAADGNVDLAAGFLFP